LEKKVGMTFGAGGTEFGRQCGEVNRPGFLA